VVTASEPLDWLVSVVSVVVVPESASVRLNEPVMLLSVALTVLVPVSVAEVDVVSP
jgi:hypothetical protein